MWGNRDHFEALVGNKLMFVRHLRPETRVARAILHERVAERAAEIARHADENGDEGSADVLWRVVHRSRVRALKLRVAGATSCSSAW